MKIDVSVTLAVLKALDDEKYAKDNAKLITLCLLSNMTKKQVNKMIDEMALLGVIEI